MRPLVGQLRSVQDALDALARRHEVPGATLAVGRGDELFDFATGVLNLSTGVETTTGSVFQIGSNTKVFTTTLIMQLVDAGQVELDAPVRRYLPDFALADPTAADEITVRQLLNHTSGIQGDYFTGFGRGDEAIERYVASLADIDLVHRPGQMWSYCNSGFAVAGRVAEVLAGIPYNKLLKERISPAPRSRADDCPQRRDSRRKVRGGPRPWPRWKANGTAGSRRHGVLPCASGEPDDVHRR